MSDSDYFENSLTFRAGSFEVWYELANSLYHLGELEKAIASYDQALEIKPDKYYVWNSRGAILCDHLSRYAEAIASFDKALEIKPDYHEAWHNRGVALRELGRHEETISSLDRALEIKPDYHEALNNRGGYWVS